MNGLNEGNEHDANGSQAGYSTQSLSPVQQHQQQQHMLLMQHQLQQQQIAASQQLASRSSALPAPSNQLLQQDAASHTNGLDNFGNSGSLSYSLDPANAAKQMAMLQAAGRSRALSHTAQNGTNPAAQISNIEAMQHAQQAILNAMLNNRPPNFVQFYAESMAKMGSPLPPAIAGTVDPSYNNPRMNRFTAGTRPGTVEFVGKEVDLHNLLMWVIQKGGSSKAALDDSVWESFLNHIELPRYVTGFGQPSTDLVHILREYYANLLQPFEPRWTSIVQQRIAAAMRQQQGLAMQNVNGANIGPMQSPANPNPQAMLLPGNPAEQHIQGSGSFQQLMPQPSSNQTHSILPTAIMPLSDGISSQSQTLGLPSMPQRSAGLSQSGQISMPGPGDFLPEPDHSSDLARSTFIHASGSLAPTALHEDLPGGFPHDEAEVRKRKRSDYSEVEAKRSKVDEGDDNNPTTSMPSAHEESASTNPPRLKIQYRPLFRQLNTYGGRNLAAFDRERAVVASKRPIRPIEEWGEVDIENIVMSLRSRLGVEISYALTTLLTLSVAGKTEAQAFPLQPCEDLVPVILELLEELTVSQPSPEDPPLASLGNKMASGQTSFSHQDLIKAALKTGTQMFHPGVEPNPASQTNHTDAQAVGSHGPTPASALIVLMILQLFRNLSLFTQNAEFLASEPKLIDLIVQICGVADNSESVSPLDPRPIVQSFTLSDLVKVRDHVLQILGNLSHLIKFEALRPETPPAIFRLTASFLLSPSSIVSPWFAATERYPGQQPPMPPPSVDLAVDVFSRVSLRDAHRKVFSQTINEGEIMELYLALNQMLPMTQDDYRVMTLHSSSLEPWVGYAERIILSLYSLVFLAPPALKRRMKKPGITYTIKRLSYFYIKTVDPAGRQFSPHNPGNSNYPFMVISRRAIELLKLLDQENDSFGDGVTPLPNSVLGMPTFGIGYGEPHGSGAKAREEGVGLLAGSWEEVVTRMMCSSGVDDEFFGEMDSLVRMGDVFEAPQPAMLQA